MGPTRRYPGSSESAVAVILAPGVGGRDLLLIRRATRRGDPWSGHIGLPGGRREKKDASPRDTAIRETLEEVGIVLKSGELCGELAELRPEHVRHPSLVIRPFVFVLRDKPPVIVSDEVAEAIWVEAASFPQRRETTRIDDDGISRVVPCFVAGKAIVWGITFRILEDFFARADAAVLCGKKG